MEKIMTNEQNKTKTKNETPAFCRLGQSVLTTVCSNKATAGALALLLGGSLIALAAGSGTDNRAPEVPEDIAVTGNYRVHFHGFALGVQIYTWNGVSWGPAVPSATLFDDDGNIVATHFAGPRWKSNSGSIVLGGVVQPTVIVDTNAIPWVKLEALATEGPGIFADTKFIQRVNTTGGKAPGVAGTFIGQVASVPYTADYFFYRQTTN
jgi:hypothetical protein